MFDIAIIGGGLAGLSLLNALRPAIQNGANVVLIDANSPPGSQQPSPSFDDRASAVSATTLELLQTWQVQSVQGTAMRHIHISEQHHAASIDLNAQQLGTELFGKVVANKALGHQLWQSKPKQAKCLHNQTVNAITFSRDFVSLKLAEESIESKLVVVADGGRSDLLARLGIAQHSQDYQQFAHVFSCRFQHPANHIAYERFTPKGALALLPMQDFFSAVLVSNNAKPNLVQEVQQRFGWRLGRVTSVGESQKYPLQLKRASEQVRSRLVVAGNSALTLHPVAGQGFNLVARSMAHIAQHCLVNYEDPGKLKDLQQLISTVKQDQLLTQSFSDGLARGFLGTALSLPRNLGMYHFDQHPLAKRWFSQFAMGSRNAAV